MHPKTFQITLRHPFGPATRHPYGFKIHAPTWEDAISWVERVLPGAEVEPAKRARANPPAVVQVGDHKPVSISDCDAFSLRKKTRDPGANEFWLEGHWRASEEDVASDLAKILGKLQSERIQMQKAFKFACGCYSRTGREWERAQAERLLAAIKLALVWQTSVSTEYLQLESRRITAPKPLGETDLDVALEAVAA